MSNKQGMTRSVTVEHVSAIRRPYGPSIRAAYLTFSVPEGQLYASKFGQTEEVAKEYAKLFIGHFVEGPERQWHEPFLDSIEQVAPGKWYIVIKQPYLD